MKSNYIKFINRFGFVILFLSVKQYTIAQDKIIKLSRDTINCKVVEVDPDFIRYDVVIKNEIVLKSIDRRDVLRIKYANGQVDSISGKRHIPVKVPAERGTQNKNIEAKKPKAENINKKNGELYIYYTFTDKFAHLISGGVTYTFPSGYISVEAPVSFGMISLGLIDVVNVGNSNEIDYDTRTGYFNPYKTFSSGLGVNYYPFPHLKSQFFVGVSIGGGLFKYIDTYYDFATGGFIANELTGSYGSIIPKVGAKFLISRHLQFSLNFGIGLTQSEIYNDYDYKPGVEAGVQIGYRFRIK